MVHPTSMFVVPLFAGIVCCIKGGKILDNQSQGSEKCVAYIKVEPYQIPGSFQIPGLYDPDGVGITFKNPQILGPGPVSIS